MSHPLKEREFLVDKAIELGVFKTLAFDKEHIDDVQIKELVEEMEEDGIDTSKTYRVVMMNERKEQVVYTSRDGLVELLKDEEGFEFVWRAVKDEIEGVIDEYNNTSFVGEELDSYDDIQV